MADVFPLKLVDAGGGQGELREFAAGDALRLPGALNEAPIVTLASAATVNIGAAAANTISIGGTTTITAFDSIASGSKRTLVFQGALTLTHNSASLILPKGANITTTAGAVAEFVSLGSGNWRCTNFEFASAASQRAALGLGSAAVLAAQSSYDDPTPGRVLALDTNVQARGVFGLGGRPAFSSIVNVDAVYPYTSFRTFLGGDVPVRGTAPSDQIPFPTSVGVLHLSRSSGDGMVQQAWGYSNTESRLAFRSNFTAWSPWVEALHTGNAASLPLTTPLAPSADNTHSCGTAAKRWSAVHAHNMSLTGSAVLAGFTLGTVPAASANTRGLIYISDLAGGAEPCFSDGTNWRRCSDRSIAS